MIVDYIGIKNDMMEAIKKYGGPQESPVDELDITIGIFQLHFSKHLIGCDVACCQRELLTYCSGSSNRGEQHPCWQGDFKGEQRSPLSGVFRGDRVPL